MNHEWHNTCKHIDMAYCVSCDTAYCRICAQQWPRQIWKWVVNPSTATWCGTEPVSATSATITSAACSHAGNA